MNELSYFVILDPQSGTFFSADSACLIDTRRLSAVELDTLNEGPDEERAQIAFAQGHDLEGLIDPSTLSYDSDFEF